MRFALDSNILIYAEGVNDEVRQRQARDLLLCLRGRDVVVSLQALCEVYSVLRRKGGFSAPAAKAAIENWMEIFRLAPTSSNVFESALGLVGRQPMQIFDAIILAAAAEAACDLFLSEGMQDGFSWGGMIIINPFTPTVHPLLEAVLRTPI